MTVAHCPTRQSFAVLRGAVLGLQDGGDNDDAAEASPEPAEEPPNEEEPHGDQTDFRQGSQSPQKQEEQRQHLHLMVQLLRPQDDIRLVRAHLELQRVGQRDTPEGRMEPCVCVLGEQWCEGREQPGECWGYPYPSDPAVSGRDVLAG